MAEHDWHAMLKEIIEMGTPIVEFGIDHEQFCSYCNDWSEHRPEHGEQCAWRRATEALADAQT